MAAPADLPTVRRILGHRRDELLARPGVTGVGVGAAEPGPGAVIVVYLDSERHLGELPDELDGVPVKPVVTGEFRAL